MTEIKVVVTGAGGGGIGEQVIKALRNGKNRYQVISTDTRDLTVAKALGDRFHRMPLASDGSYIQKLISLCNEYDCRIVIPGSEPELLRIAASIDEFRKNSIYVPINSAELISVCSDKIQFHSFLEKSGFEVCETHIIDGSVEYSNFRNFPYIIKPVRGSGSKNVFIVQSREELENVIKYLGEQGDIMVQEYVGTADEEYTVGILSTPSGYVNHICLKRDLSLGMSVKQSVPNRTNKDFLGQKLVVSTGISQGMFVENSVIDNTVMKLVGLLKPTSTINMQCRIQNGQLYIFEINPRFSGTTNLRTLVGFNEPEYLINNYLSAPNSELDHKTWINRTVLRGIQEYLIN